MKEEDEVLATQRLLDVVRRGEARTNGGLDPRRREGEPLYYMEGSPPEGMFLTPPPRQRIRPFRKTRVGLDIGNRTAKMAWVERGPKGFRLLQLGMAVLPSGEEAVKDRAEAIRALLRDVPLPRTPVVTCINHDGMIIRQTTLPKMSRKDLLRTLPFEARRYIPYELSRVQLRYQILEGGRRDPSFRVLLVAVPKEAVEQHHEFLRRMGLQPYAVEPGPLSLVNSYWLSHPAEDETVVLLDMGASRTVIDIQRREGLLFSRQIPICTEDFTRSMASRWNLSFEEADRVLCGLSPPPGSGGETEILEAVEPVMEELLVEIRRSLAYYDNVTGRLGFSRLFLSGGGSALPGLAAHLEGQLGLPTALLDPFKGLRCELVEAAHSWMQRMRPLWSLAVGLATRR